MKSFIPPLQPREVRFEAPGVGGIVAVVGIALAAIGLCMGIMA